MHSVFPLLTNEQYHTFVGDREKLADTDECLRFLMAPCERCIRRLHPAEGALQADESTILEGPDSAPNHPPEDSILPEPDANEAAFPQDPAPPPPYSAARKPDKYALGRCWCCSLPNQICGRPLFCRAKYAPAHYLIDQDGARTWVPKSEDRPPACRAFNTSICPENCPAELHWCSLCESYDHGAQECDKEFLHLGHGPSRRTGRHVSSLPLLSSQTIFYGLVLLLDAFYAPPVPSIREKKSAKNGYKYKQCPGSTIIDLAGHALPRHGHGLTTMDRGIHYLGVLNGRGLHHLHPPSHTHFEFDAIRSLYRAVVGVPDASTNKPLRARTEGACSPPTSASGAPNGALAAAPEDLPPSTVPKYKAEHEAEHRREEEEEAARKASPELGIKCATSERRRREQQAWEEVCEIAERKPPDWLQRQEEQRLEQ
ncbi:hypothetical protein GGF50DRAFT_92112 [Schizophyllum commune]